MRSDFFCAPSQALQAALAASEVATQALRRELGGARDEAACARADHAVAADMWRAWQQDVVEAVAQLQVGQSVAEAGAQLQVGQSSLPSFGNPRDEGSCVCVVWVYMAAGHGKSSGTSEGSAKRLPGSEGHVWVVWPGLVCMAAGRGSGSGTGTAARQGSCRVGLIFWAALWLTIGVEVEAGLLVWSGPSPSWLHEVWQSHDAAAGKAGQCQMVARIACHLDRGL
eukprot:1158535-Pelagomonas_calceolata.AAC.2